ncbi:hypothetical protein B0T16DRAFT_319790 [Cercophora newfieldiana]|uniref:RRM domain-containing protein n=1 Tax=Cercophora newfieldiana TaxID=92897 RepID=A0AA39YMB0_9PEZI|nr:hypothetical protein B0T16DRAFT_319790 [Cercophora newfieldiana]
MMHFPFITSYSQSHPKDFGVVRIKNIPYATSRSEILAIFGRKARLPRDTEEPVHIIMDKSTCKTQDAFVEFATVNDAIKAVRRFQDSVKQHHRPRLENRLLDMELSSQAELLKALFPFACGVTWNGAAPYIGPEVPGEPWTVFKGYVTEEEMTLLVRFVEVPSRSPFAKDCPQRPYECMISTLKKIPWFRPDTITVMERHIIFTATIRLCGLLRGALDAPRYDSQGNHINDTLLRRFFNAAMLCPGFSVVQKDNIAFACRFDEKKHHHFNIPRHANSWVYQHIVCPKPSVPVDVLEYYIALIREETVLSARENNIRELYERIAQQPHDTDDTGYFGFAWLDLNLPHQKELIHWSIASLGDHEMAVLQRIVHRALTRR